MMKRILYSILFAGLCLLPALFSCSSAVTADVNEIVINWDEHGQKDDGGKEEPDNPDPDNPDPDDPTPPTPPEPTGKIARCRISDSYGYDSAEEATIRKRADIYSRIGVNHVRWGMTWISFEGSEGNWKNLTYQPFKYLKIMVQEHGMRLTFIPNIVSDVPSWMKTKHPDCCLKSHDGLSGCLSYWYPDFMDIVREKNDVMFAKMKAAGLWDSIDYIEPALGMAGEPIYPPAWTLGLSEEKFWCYDDNAVKDFREKMKAKYSSVATANSRWNTSFSSWEEVTVCQPGKVRGKYWEDVLIWYRDSKREKVIAILDYYKELLKGTGKKILINVPGVQYTEAEWNAAVSATDGGGSSIRIMNDSDFLLDWAVKNGEYVEYTGMGPGSSNISELKRIAAYLRGKGLDGHLWAENVGDDSTASRIDNLKQQVLDNKLYGFDYTHGFYLFNSDGTLIQERADKLKALYEALDKMWNNE